MDTPKAPNLGSSSAEVKRGELYGWPAASGWEPDDGWVAEAPLDWQRLIPEKLLHCLWFDPRWRPTALRTLDGQPITVHSPGRWNVHPGPDFQQATITFADGERRRGDVEIHRYASGWTAHRHHSDPRYNNVMLHVFLWNDRKDQAAVRADGQPIPQVALEHCLPRPLLTYRTDVVLEDYPRKNVPFPGRCYEALRRLEPGQVRAFLDRAGDVRLRQRMRRWAPRVSEAGLEQAAYEAVLRGLGSTGHRQHFQELASTVSWREAQACLDGVPASVRRLAAEALLLGVAGLLPDLDHADRFDDDTQRYIADLYGHWLGFPATIRQRAWHTVNWRQPNVRPANSPERRLAGMACLLDACHGTTLIDTGVSLCSSLVADNAKPRELCDALTALLTCGEPSYWTRRPRFGSRQGRSQHLIGAGRALTVVVDALLPMLLLFVQHRADTSLRDSLLACYEAAPRLPDNHALRYMARRLLGDDPSLLSLVAGARQEQGLLQLLNDYCGNDEGDCQGCDFPLH